MHDSAAVPSCYTLMLTEPVFDTAGAMQRFNDTEGYNPRESNVLRMLGYFSLIGLQRVHTLVGDYHGAPQSHPPAQPV